jgi:DNA-binding transcriptional LysR family regulator
MEFRHLRSFLALTEELHFGRAAAKLHLTQPSLSQQLQRLERKLSVTLLERTSHEVRLTPAGEVFRDHARVIVQRMDGAAQAAREAAAGRHGTVRVGYTFSAWQEVLPKVLARMHERHPRITVKLTEMRSGAAQAALAAGELDLAFGHGRPAAAGLRHRRMMEVPIVALVGAGHPWARLPRVDFADLARHRCILFGREQNPAMYDAILTAADRRGIRLDIAHHVDDLNATALVVATQPVVAFVSRHRGEHAAAGGLGSVAVPFTAPAPAVDMHVMWRPGQGPSPTRALLGCLDEMPLSRSGTGQAR